MNRRQTNFANPILNTYAHGYLSLPPYSITVAGARRDGHWILLISIAGREIETADSLDAAKTIIDEFAASYGKDQGTENNA